MQNQPILIKNWQNGVADSEFLGFGAMKMVDIEIFPGSVKCQKKPINYLTIVAQSSTFTVYDLSTNLCVWVTGLLPATGTPVIVSSTGTLPAGLASSTVYWIRKPYPGTDFKLATTYDNAIAGLDLDITDAGTGTHTIRKVIPGTIRHFVKDYRSDLLFCQDSSGYVWYLNGTEFKLLSGNTLTNAAGNGLVIFATANTIAASAIYLLAFTNSTIDIINVYSSAGLTSPSWTKAWQALNSGAGAANSHHSIVGQDGIVYFCDAQYVGSLKENIGSTFAPGTGATFTYNNQALDTPSNEICQWLEELGVNLLIAGKNFNFIYPWDRLSNSYTLPIAVPERQILKLKNSGGIVYILAGTNGNIYTTQGTYVNLFKKIPMNLMNAAATIQSNPVTWGSIAIRNSALIIGCSGLTAGNSGVYLIYPDGRIVLDNIPTTGAANVTALFCETDYYFLGFAGGIDAIADNSSRYSDYTSVIQSQLFMVGNKTQKASYSTVEIQLAKPTTGSVKISSRSDTSSAFVEIVTFTLDGTNTSFETDAGLTDLENVQFQIELSGDVELLEVRILP